MPRTEPMEKNFIPSEAEKRILHRWLESHAFRAGANAKPGKPPYTIMIPPPNVTGSLHVGHAFNNTLQDILIRWHRMRGFDTLWQPGTDHAGIATQMVTEREMAQNGEPDRRTMGREAFIKRVWKQKRSSRKAIIGQLQRLGASCDWEREAFTMSGAPGAPEGEEGNFHDAVIRVFVELYEQGLIFRGKKLVNWDPKLETAISDLEVESRETDGHMWHFKYPLAGGASYEYVEHDAEGRETLRERRDYISIATTRPETMLGDGAIAVHPDDARYQPLIGMMCEIPVGPKESRRQIPIIADPYPDPSFGSGAVKITGAHDFNDYEVAKRAGLPLYRLMDGSGRMRNDGPSYADHAAAAQQIARGERSLDEEAIDALNLVPDHLRGLDRFEARKKIVEEITAEGLAVMTRADDPRLGKGALKGVEDPGASVPLVEAKKIMQPFGSRSNVVIEPMLTDQWFVDSAKIVAPAIEAVRSGRIKILPPSGEKVYFHWLENIEPWCISRQLWWGHQIPVWYGPPRSGREGDDRPHFCGATQEEVAKKARAYYGEGVKVRFATKEGEGARGAGPLERIDGQVTAVFLAQEPDVLDTWFSSGLWPIGTLGWPEQTDELARYFPTSVLITGQDILFFWVARMIMMQLSVVGEVPFHTVYLHGLVRDAKGKKMSKSLGNVIDPLEIIDEFGADALRFANAAMASLSGVLRLERARIAGYRNFGTKLWNACRFAEMNGVWEGHQGAPEPPAAKAPLNRWIISQTRQTLREVDSALDVFRFDEAAMALYALVWGKVCDWYVEFSKPLFAGDQADETRQTMAWVLDQCMIMLHPFMPFITEELWSITGTRAGMLIHQDWPEPSPSESAQELEANEEMAWVISVIEAIRSARAQLRVPAGERLEITASQMSAEARARWTANAAMIERLARVAPLRESPAAPSDAIAIPAKGADLALSLGGVIDIAQEKERLHKTLEKLQKEIAGLEGRLNNAAFCASAPEEVVTEARANLAAREEEAAQLRGALARLGG